jgi:hypothetical protein
VTRAGGLVRHKLALASELGVLSFVAVNTVLDITSELSDKTLNRPGSSVTQRADRVTFDLVRQLFQHVDLSEVSVTDLHTLEHVYHPPSTLTTRRALTTRLVLVEFGQSKDRINDISLIVHDDDGSSS